MIKHAADRSVGVLSPEDGKIHIEDSKNTSFFIRLYLKNTKATFTLLNMCGCSSERLKDIKLLNKSAIPAEASIGKLLQYFMKGPLDEEQPFKTLLENKKIFFVVFLNESTIESQAQPILSLTEK